MKTSIIQKLLVLRDLRLLDYFYLQLLQLVLCRVTALKKVQVGKDQEKAQSERDSHSKNRGGKKPN